MQPAMMVAFGCYLFAALLSALVGVFYLARREFMPYHAVAAGTPWEGLPTGLRVLLLAMIRGIGAGFLAVGAIILFLLVYPFRAGDAWAMWAIPLVGLTMGLPTLHGVHAIRTRTPARPPWRLTVLTVGCFAVGATVTLFASLG